MRRLEKLKVHISSLYIYHFSTVLDFSSEKYSGSTDTGTPGTSIKIYSKDADGEIRTRNPSVINRVLLSLSYTAQKLLLGRS